MPRIKTKTRKKKTKAIDEVIEDESSPVKDFIDSESDSLAREMSSEEFPEDDEYEPPEEGSSHSRSAIAAKIDEEEAIIDELLASVPQGQGYYLKLYKMLMNNEPEFKLRIDNWQNWSDLEYEINVIVREHTKNFGVKRWGSGRYKIVIWRDGGVRGPKVKPYFFQIDAQEPDEGLNASGVIPIQPGVSGTEQLMNFTQILETINRLNPRPDPAAAQDSVASAFSKGLELSANKEQGETNSVAAMMATMMTGMTSMMSQMMQMNANKPETIPPKDPNESLKFMMEALSAAGVFQKNNPVAPVSSNTGMAALKELQTLGLIPAVKPEGNKLLELKSMMELVKDFSSAGRAPGEVPSLMEKLVEVLAPRVPEMIGNVTSAVNNAVQLKKAQYLSSIPRATANVPQAAPATPVQEATPQALPNPYDNNIEQIDGQVGDTPAQLTNESEVNQDMLHLWPKYKSLFNQLHEKIVTHNPAEVGSPATQDAFLEVASRMEEVIPGITEKISTSALSSVDMVQFIGQYGDPRFKDPAFIPQLTKFTEDFVQWVQRPRNIVAKCNECTAIFDFETQEEFNKDPKICGMDKGGGITCNGTLQLVTEEGQEQEQISNEFNPTVQRDILKDVEMKTSEELASKDSSEHALSVEGDLDSEDSSMNSIDNVSEMIGH